MNDKLDAEIAAKEAELETLEMRRDEERAADLRARPLLDRMIFAATSRCECGAGMAYDPASEGDGVFKGPSKWECSDILLFKTYDAERQAAVKAATHDEGFPFALYEIKSERQPSQRGMTTRPEAEQ